MVKKKRCLRCNKVLKVREGAKRLNPIRKCCDRICQVRYGSKEYYDKPKDEQWFKDKQKKSFNRWLNNNRPHFNDLVREPMRLYGIRKRKEARKKGFCISCFKRPARENMVACEKCSNRQKELRRLKKEK